ncbi:MAG: Hpt domain-containing protein [Burkholderiales bacterium]|jgi:HPt (histidine-containing phosphotransfer) domain-containing protein
MAEAPIDRATFAELKETAGAAFVTDLVETFLVEAPRMLDDMRSTLAAGSIDGFRRAAHSLKSNSNTFGALALGVMARDLELTAAERVTAGNAQPVDALEQEYARVAQALTELKRA